MWQDCHALQGQGKLHMPLWGRAAPVCVTTKLMLHDSASLHVCLTSCCIVGLLVAEFDCMEAHLLLVFSMQPSDSTCVAGEGS